jgi:DNA primase
MTQPEITKEACVRLDLFTYEKRESWRGNVTFRCPFHEDKTPSMFVHMEKGIYRCFSCERSGTIAGMYWDINHRSLYRDLGCQADEFTKINKSMYRYEEPDYENSTKDINIDIQAEVIPFAESPECKRYLRKRGISFDVATKMQFKFIKQGNVNGTIYKDRLVIPVFEQMRLVSLEGRDITGTQPLKVVYPRHSTVNTLYDLDILDFDEPLFVVEGLMDLAVLRSDPYFANSTVIFGASITRRQIYLLKKFKTVILIPDNDLAGRASVRHLLENLGKLFYVLEVPVVDGISIKDVGDIPTLLKTTVIYLRKRGWGEVLKPSTEIRLLPVEKYNTKAVIGDSK